MTVTPDPWIVRHKPRPAARLRLFCFPYAGGTASAFRLWWQHLPDDVEVCAVQLPGREGRLREPLFRRMPQLVETLAGVLKPSCNVPFAFLGHSVGALLGFELARHLRQTGGCLPVALFVSGRRAPHLPDPVASMYDLPEAEFIEQLRQRYQALPEAVVQDAELRAIFLPIVRADVELADTYVYSPQPPLECPITAFGGLEDTISREHLAAWQDLTNGSFQVHMLPGDHFFLQTEATALLRLVSRDLGKILHVHRENAG